MSQQSKIGTRATTVHTNEQGQTQVIYHTTAAVNFNPKLIILNHGGWMTNTTKTRMNQASVQFSLGYHVYQDNFDWWVIFKGEHLPFEGRTIELIR